MLIITLQEKYLKCIVVVTFKTSFVAILYLNKLIHGCIIVDADDNWYFLPVNGTIELNHITFMIMEF